MYPQPNADGYAINGYQFFRLNTLLSSPGDIYESAQGGLAFAIGPESDIGKVNVAYFDDQVPNFMNQTSLGPSRSFVGRLDAKIDRLYMPAARPGKVLIWSDDLYDPGFRPAGFSPLTNKIIIEQPRLDVIEYFRDVPSLLPARNDKTYQFQDVPTGALGAPGYVLLPYWGRRYAFIELTNKSTGPTSFGVFGVNFSPNTAFHQVTTILATAPVAVNAQVIQKVTSLANGMFDMLMFEFLPIGPGFDPVMGPFKCITSDTAQD